MANQYLQGAKDGKHEVVMVHLRDLKFDPILRGGYKGKQKMERDLQKQQELLKWCEHLVIATPVWWMGTPALLKGYFDRVLTPGFAYKFTSRMRWKKFLKGRSARIMYSQGSPFWATFLVYGDSFWRSVKGATLNFVGFSPVRRTVCASATRPSEHQMDQWLSEAYWLGKSGL